MNKLLVFLLLLTPCPGNAVESSILRTISLQESVQIALNQSPEMQLARLEVDLMANGLARLRSERNLNVHAGSGLGATEGIPQSISGATPSVAQLTLSQPLLDFARQGHINQAKELVKAEEYSAAARRELTAYRVGMMYLDFERAAWNIDRLERELNHFEQITKVVQARTEEGREIPLAVTRTRLDSARARGRLQSWQTEYSLLEAELRTSLSLGIDQHLQPHLSDSTGSREVPLAKNEVRTRAGEDHPELAAISARIDAQRYQVKAALAGRLPKLDLVGQYALLARFNNYDAYFQSFQHHNWQAGIALQIPLFTGRGVAERVARARLEERKLELQQQSKRSDLELAGFRAYQALQEVNRGSDLSKLELEYARQNLDVILVQFEEGRIALDDLESAGYLNPLPWVGCWMLDTPSRRLDSPCFMQWERL